MPVHPLIILDRDGVLNFDSDAFIKSPQEWRPIPGSLEAVARLNQAGYRVVVCTNQSGIARGLFSMATLNAIHQKMHGAAQQVGAHFDAVFFCPHASDDNCDCRKPKPGMLNGLAERLDVNMKGVPTVGDSLRDLQAGFVVGCVPYLVLTGKGEKTRATGGLPPGTRIFANLAAVVDRLLEAESAAPAQSPASGETPGASALPSYSSAPSSLLHSSSPALTASPSPSPAPTASPAPSPLPLPRG